MVTIKLITLLLLLFSFHARASYFCTAENSNGGISYEDSNHRSWEVIDLSFDRTPILDPYLACMRFLESVPPEWNLSTKLQPLYPEKDGVVRLGFGDPMIELCVKTPGCHLNPLYGIFRPKLILQSLFKASSVSSLPLCGLNAKKSEDGLDLGGSDEKIRPVDVQMGKVVSIPEKNLEDHLMEELDRKKPKQLFISTMILSSHILHQVDEWLLRNPKSEGWVFFSFNLQALERTFPGDSIIRSPNLHLFPVFQTPGIDETFHIKGVALDSDEKSTWLMTVNIRRFREEKVADRLIELKGQDVFESFKGILSTVLDQQCREVEQLKCSNALRFGLSSDRSKLVESWVKNTCSHRFFKKDSSKRFFYQGGKAALEEGLMEWIDSAKKEILVSSHILKDSAVLDSLLEAADRGVRVKVLVGTDVNIERWLKKTSPLFSVVKRVRGAGTISHAKFMVFDQETAFWGTGNFTRTSLHNPWEIFLATQNPKFISVLGDYMRQYGGENDSDRQTSEGSSFHGSQ